MDAAPSSPAAPVPARRFIWRIDRARGTGNGFKFERYDASAMLEKISEALYCYGEPEVWRVIQLNGMRVDNSWHAAAQKYLELYRATAQT